MDHIEVVPNMDRWPSFHNGVAAGLRIPTGQDRYKDCCKKSQNLDENFIQQKGLRFLTVFFCCNSPYDFT